MPASIASAQLSHWALVASAMGDAFTSDPVFSWLIPSARRRPAALRRYFAIEGREVALRHGLSTVASDKDETDVVGAALILPPGHWRIPPKVMAGLAPAYTSVFGLRLPRALKVITTMEKRHAVHGADPHYYLGYVGVARRAQGHGTGTRLLQAMLDRADDEKMPSYLEASAPENVRLYERLGFRTLETINPAGSPPIELMRREPS